MSRLSTLASAAALATAAAVPAAAFEVSCLSADLSALASAIYVKSSGTDGPTCGSTHGAACATIGQGMSRCGSLTAPCGVLVDAGTYALGASLNLTAGAALYGGCAPPPPSAPPSPATTPHAERSLLQAPAGGVPAIVANGVTARVQGFKVQGSNSADGTGGTQGADAPGGATTTILVRNDGILSLADSLVIAATGGRGADGLAGTVGRKGADAQGSAAPTCCPGTGSCGSCCGEGPFEQVKDGDNESDCTPQAPTGPLILAGSDWTRCYAVAGEGAQASTDQVGSFRADGAWQAPARGDGSPGGNGMGGRKLDVIDKLGGLGDNEGHTALMGGGGCGGGGGRGGSSGGGSFGIVVINATAHLDTVRVAGGIGGAGGNGGKGTAGGAPGGGELKSLFGGSGGGGAGGSGGPAICLAEVGDDTFVDATHSSFVSGRGGAGGAGGGSDPTTRKTDADPPTRSGGAGAPGLPGQVSGTTSVPLATGTSAAAGS